MLLLASCVSWACHGGLHDMTPKHATLDAPLTCEHATIYGASWCEPCHFAARHLRRRGVDVTERDIEKDDEALRWVRTRSQRGISLPTIDLCGDVVIGYNPDHLDEAITRPREPTTP